MNEWMNEIFNGFVILPYFIKNRNIIDIIIEISFQIFKNIISYQIIEISFWKEQENHNNIYCLYKVYAYDNSRYYNLYEWIRLGLYNNSLIFCDTYMSVPHWSRPTINRPK